MSNQMIDISNLDLAKICRTCLSEGDMQPLYKRCLCTDEEQCVAEKLMSCTLIQFHRNDGLPTQICLKCIKEIDNAYQFARKCEKSDEILREYLKKSKTPPTNNKNTKTLRKNTKIQPRTKIKTRSQESKKNCQIDVEIKSENEEDDLSHTTTFNPFSKDNNHINKDQTIIPKNEINKTDSDYEDFGLDENYDSDENIKNEIKNELQDLTLNGHLKDEYSENSDSEYVQPNRNKYKRMRRLNNTRVKKVVKIKSVPPYECKKCFMSYPTFKELAEHRRQAQHPKNMYSNRICPICNKSVGYSRLNQHMRTHTQEKPYCCELCGTRFSISSNLRRHMMSRHSTEKPYKCELCEKGFTRLGLLKDHMRTHTGERPFVCNFCGKSFAQSSSFRTHLFNHAKKGENTGQISEQEHLCAICQRSFATRALLRAHQVIHGEKKFLCSDCGKGFVSMILLKSHSKVHSGVRPHGCAVCGKTFSHIGSLKSHMLIHTGQKPYVCKICNRAFTQRNHVKYHMRTHSGERPYICSVCGKSFALNGNLTVHMRTHTGETPYLCPVCGKGFHDSSSMKKHQRGHGEQLSHK